MSSLKNQIKANRSRVFRRAYIKRRNTTDGLFETNWVDISQDVMKWGKITNAIDERQYNKFKFNGMQIQVANDSGRFNSELDPSSLWFGFLPAQRSLVRIEAGFVHETLGANGIWTRTEYPQEIIKQTTSSYLYNVTNPASTLVTNNWLYAWNFTSPSFVGNLDSIRIPLTRSVSVGGYFLVNIFEGASVTGNTPVYSKTVAASTVPNSNLQLSVGAGTLFEFGKSLNANSNYWFVLSGTELDLTTSAWGFVHYDSTGAGEPFYRSLDSGTSYSLLGYGAGYRLSITVATVAAAFTGFISGDLQTNDLNQITLDVKPLTELFRQYPARLLDNYTSTGLTASEFVTMVRDHTDGAGSYVFLPFFGDTTTGFNIQSTSNNYANLNTQTAEDIIDANVWSVIETLAQAETYVPYVNRAGVFNFVDKSGASISAFEFHGARSFDREWGKTITKITKYGVKFSKYYPRVDVRWQDSDSASSVQTIESEFQVTAGNLPWIYGLKTYKLENYFIQDADTALTIANTIFQDVSSLKNEIEFEASFVPQLDILDRINITYDNAIYDVISLWDLNNWADTSGAALDGTELIWDEQDNDALKIFDVEFKLLKIELNLDKLTTKIVAREL